MEKDTNSPTLNTTGTSQFPNNVDAELSEILDRLRVVESKMSCKYETITDPAVPDNVKRTIKSIKYNVIALWYFHEALGVGEAISKERN